MEISAELSLYPLGTEDLGGPIRAFALELEGHGMALSMGAMSSTTTGPLEQVFDAVKKAFATVAAERQCVLVAKFSNACPVAPNR
jgi:uncharacterized protein YqgV (UPF0045/DUF77 family)